jgi:hypothetical protein
MHTGEKQYCLHCNNELTAVTGFRCICKIENEDQVNKDCVDVSIMVSCPSCQKPSAPNSEFCSNCGTKIEKQLEEKRNFLACSKCGNSAMKTDKFCTSCGEPNKSLGTSKKDFCAKCRKEQNETDKFCPSCGLKNDFSNPENNENQASSQSVNNFYEVKEKSLSDLLEPFRKFELFLYSFTVVALFFAWLEWITYYLKHGDKFGSYLFMLKYGIGNYSLWTIVIMIALMSDISGMVSCIKNELYRKRTKIAFYASGTIIISLHILLFFVAG